MSREFVQLHGILLKIIPYAENDSLLQLLTAEKGKVIIFAKKSSSNNKSNSYSQPFAYSKFELISRGHGMMVYSGSQMIEYFPELRQSPYAMAAGEYLCEVSTFVPENIDNPNEYLSLLLNSLYLLTGRKIKNIDINVIKLVFEIAFLQLSGLMPNPKECSSCVRKPEFWQIDEGFLCDNCAEKLHFSEIHKVDKNMFAAIDHIMTVNGVRRYSFTMNSDSLKSLIYLSEQYMKYRLEAELKTLNVYKSLIDRV
jgi:DNA repair protein RecO (recombination protein O)